MPFRAFRSLSPIAQIGFATAITLAVVGAVVAVMIVFLQSDLTTAEKTQIGTMVTIAGGFAVKEWRDSRNRAWAKKDREDGLRLQTAEIIERAQAEAKALMISTEAKAKAIRMEVAIAAAEVREDQRVNSEMLASQIAEVKAVATDAVREANHVNEKIANLNQRLLTEEQSPEKKAASQATDKKLDALQDSVNVIKDRPTAEKLDALQDTADEIEAKVDDLSKKE